MGLAESVLAAGRKIEGLMFAELPIGSGFGDAVTDGSDSIELCSLFGIL